MHARLGEEIACRLLGSTVSVDVPDALADRVRNALERLPTLPGARLTGVGPASGQVAGGDTISVRLTPSAAGWSVELAGQCSVASNEVEAVLRLQEMLIESATSRAGTYLVFRGSIVARGSQCVLIVGDRGSTHALVAIALTSLGFRLVSVGTAALEDRSLIPLPLPLAFALEPQEHRMLEAAGLSLPEHLEIISEHLFRPLAVGPAPEPTHVLFPETHLGGLSIVRPVAAAAARSRLCQAMLSAPADVQPFAAVASVLRHTRGIRLSLGDVTQALEQLGRLLPRWSVE